jgi:YbgC/YbaW family acyl-CoA thioester hydrolase
MFAMAVKSQRSCETRAVQGYTFSTTVRVRFADTDAQGIAHNASYLVWFEVARVEYLREHAGGYQALRDRGFEALVLESFCRYLVPTRFDDVLNVHARCVDVRGARFPLRVPDRARRRRGRCRRLDATRMRRRADTPPHPRARVAGRCYPVG